MAILVSAPKGELDRRWSALVGSLGPVLGKPTVKLILDQGDGGGFDYWDAIDVRTQAGYRVAVVPSALLRAGIELPEIDLRKAIAALTKAGAVCGRYDCVGPGSSYTVRFGVAPTTTRLIIEAREDADLAPLWDNLRPL